VVTIARLIEKVEGHTTNANWGHTGAAAVGLG
jgi:hypothetical protein